MGNSFVVTPCKDCSERFIGCHGQENGRHRCEKYGDYCRYIQQKRKESKSGWDEANRYKYETAQNWNWKMLREKKRRSFR